MDHKLLLDLITIPVFTGVIGYITNWTGVLMLFEPPQFHGFRMPGLKFLYPYFPRRIQILPIFKEGRYLGWQGMVPSRAEKMASIAVDRSLVKVGDIGDFYRELDPDSIAEYFVGEITPRIPALVDDVMMTENPRLWQNMPQVAKEFVYQRVVADLPKNSKRITTVLGEYLTELIDAKFMAVRVLTQNPELLNNVFKTMGAKELRFMQNFGLYFGYPMGFVVVGLVHLWPYWWVLIVGGVVIGWVVNYIGLTMIFEPTERTWYVPWQQGLLLKRRDEITVGFGEMFSKQVMTLPNIAEEMMSGPRADRAQALMERVLSETIDDAVGRAKIAVRAAIGGHEYERMKLAALPVAIGVLPEVIDDEFVQRQESKIAAFVETQMSKLDNADFGQMLRAAVKQDEWLLFVHGGILGAAAGVLHLAIFPL